MPQTAPAKSKKGPRSWFICFSCVRVWHHRSLPAAHVRGRAWAAPRADGPPPRWASGVVTCTLWGIGTAAGEIPPYQFSYMAAVSGERNAELEAELEATTSTEAASFTERKFNDMKQWMVQFIKRHGFLGIYLMCGTHFLSVCGPPCSFAAASAIQSAGLHGPRRADLLRHLGAARP